MRAVNTVRDEQQACAIVYSFTKGFNDPVEMSIYNFVLPFMYSEIFRNNILKSTSYKECVELCRKENYQYGEEIKQNIQDLEILTSKILGLALINQMLTFDVHKEQMSGTALDSQTPLIKEAYLLGKWFKSLTVEEILDGLEEYREKIVILGSNTIGEDIDLTYYANLGELRVHKLVKDEDVPNLIKDATIVVTNKNNLNEESLKDAEKLKLICVFATGYNNIDIDYCRSRGIKVANVKDYSTPSVVQHTFALFFYLYEKLPYYDHYVKSGRYINDVMFTHFEKHFNEILGKTWGIVGLGNIGKKVATVAEMFGANVIYYSTSGNHDDKDFKRVDFETLLKESDVISIHAPLTEETYHLFDEDAFRTMKNSSYLINVGRGAIIDEQALRVALEQNRIAGAGLDVLSEEPMKMDNPLLRIKNSMKLIVTPHIAWASVEARNRVAKEVYLNIESFLNHKDRNIVG